MSTKTLETIENTGFKGFALKTVNEEIIKFMKFAFDATFDNMVKIQELNEKMIKDMLDKGKEIQADAVLLADDYIENAKKGRDEYRKVIEGGFNSIENMLKAEN